MINLEAGDITKNTLLKISQSLQCVATILELYIHTEPVITLFKSDTLVPRVPSITRQWTKGAKPYNQTKYDLRQRNNKNTSSHHHLAQQVFSKPHVIHVYHTNGRREHVNSLLFGEDSIYVGT